VAAPAYEIHVTIAERIALSDLNYAEALRELARRAGGIVHDERGVMLYAAPHPLPVLSNGAMRTDPAVPAAEVLARAREFFARQQRGYSVLVAAHLDEDLRTAAIAAGLPQMGDMPGMVLDHRLPAVTSPSGVTLHRVATDADRIAFADVMEAAYGTYGMPPGVTPLLFARLDVLVAPHIVSYLAELDGRPAAGAMVVVTHGVAGIYWVGTIPDARGHGLAELCTRAAGNAGFDCGARIAALQASTMGEPIYRRMGYVEVTRYPYLVQFNAPEL
jgi:GNAT superfamily N-acetyltransferase